MKTTTNGKTGKCEVFRLFETKSVEEIKQPGEPPSATSEGNIVNIVVSVEVSPKHSLRVEAEEAETSKDSVHRIIKKQKIRQFKSKLVHQLLPGDYRQRLEFCNLALSNFAEDPNFGVRIIFTD